MMPDCKLDVTGAPVIGFSDLFGVILADPPWPYSDGGHGNGRARDHYPLMKIQDIFAMPVKRVLAADAVMILWATWPQLDNAFKLVWVIIYLTHK